MNVYPQGIEQEGFEGGFLQALRRRKALNNSLQNLLNTLARLGGDLDNFRRVYTKGCSHLLCNSGRISCGEINLQPLDRVRSTVLGTTNLIEHRDDFETPFLGIVEDRYGLSLDALAGVHLR